MRVAHRVQVVAAASQEAFAYATVHSPEAMKFKARGIAVMFVSLLIRTDFGIRSCCRHGVGVGEPLSWGGAS